MRYERFVDNNKSCTKDDVLQLCRTKTGIANGILTYEHHLTALGRW